MISSVQQQRIYIYDSTKCISANKKKHAHSPIHRCIYINIYTPARLPTRGHLDAFCGGGGVYMISGERENSFRQNLYCTATAYRFSRKSGNYRYVYHRNVT